jgi:LPXTG-motif cell wall-anchored protein
MYGSVLGAATTTAATATVLSLPNTGGNFVVNLAISVGAGLVAWGVLYARASR